MFFYKTIKHVKRIREVGHVLLRHGFEEVVTSTALGKLVPQKTRLSWLRGEKPVFEYSRWERIRMVVEDLGPTFIKLGRKVFYRPEDLDAWINARSFTSTSEYPATLSKA
ncbi:MAG: hypothetical protein O7F74_09450, partial [Bacteroidetes bacterium]|nr:hypothetical protein [Bacteroidota bacterium]